MIDPSAHPLVLRDAFKRHGAGAVVGPIALQVPAGRTLALIGPSAAGKSTVLRMLLGLVPPDGGQVLFRGQDIGVRDDVLRRRIGYVVQGGGLFPHLTARENVVLLARYVRWPRDRIDARVAELTGIAQLEPAALARYPGELSGGQAQRVALMRALMLDPEVLLLDEPLGALDPLTRSDLQRDLRAAFAALQKTVVIVTHDLGEAVYFAHRLVLMRDGRVVQEGTLHDLLSTPSDPFVTRFLQAQRGVAIPERA